MQPITRPVDGSGATDARSSEAPARWQIYPSDMEAFRLVDAQRAGRLWSLKNAMKMPKNVPMEGFPIAVGPGFLAVADRTHAYGLAEFGTVGEAVLCEGEPGFLEVSTILETGGVPIIHVLRLPVPAGARDAAARALAYIDSEIAAPNRERIHRRFVAHFEAADQKSDAPHRLQRRRKWLIPALGLFLLTLLATIFLLFLT